MYLVRKTNKKIPQTLICCLYQFLLEASKNAWELIAVWRRAIFIHIPVFPVEFLTTCKFKVATVGERINLELFQKTWHLKIKT